MHCQVCCHCSILEYLEWVQLRILKPFDGVGSYENGWHPQNILEHVLSRVEMITWLGWDKLMQVAMSWNIYISPRFHRLVGGTGAKELHNTEKIFETFCFCIEITSLEGHFEIISQIPCYREPKKIYILSIYDGRQRLASKDNSVSKTMKIFLQHQTAVSMQMWNYKNVLL